MVALALLLPVAVQAQEPKSDRWKGIGISTDGDTVFIDTRSIVQDHDYEVSVWVESRLKTARTDGFGKNYIRHLVRMTYDCKARTVSSGSWLTLTKNGSVAASGNTPFPLNRSSDIPPGSLAETILEAVCSRSNERLAPGTGGGSRVNYPPTPTELFVPPLPMPDRVRGFHLVAEYEIDETGEVMDFKFTPTPDARYNRRLEEVLKSFKFRPGTTPDGTPIRMKRHIVYDF